MQFLQEILDIISHYAKPFRDFLADMLRRILALFNRTSKDTQNPVDDSVDNNIQKPVHAKSDLMSDALNKLKANPGSFTLALDLFRELEAKAELVKKEEELRKKQMNRAKWH